MISSALEGGVAGKAHRIGAQDLTNHAVWLEDGVTDATKGRPPVTDWFRRHGQAMQERLDQDTERKQYSAPTGNSFLSVLRWNGHEDKRRAMHVTEWDHTA